MLAQQGILTSEEQKQSKLDFYKLKKRLKVVSLNFHWLMKIFIWLLKQDLLKLLENLGKDFITARSRNDQVATDFRLYVQDKSLSIKEQLKELVETFVNVAGKYTTTLIPGMTHITTCTTSFWFSFISLCKYV